MSGKFLPYKMYWEPVYQPAYAVCARRIADQADTRELIQVAVMSCSNGDMEESLRELRGPGYASSCSVVHSSQWAPR